MAKKIKTLLIIWIIVETIYAGVYMFIPQLNKTIGIGFLWLWLMLTIFGLFPRYE